MYAALVEMIQAQPDNDRFFADRLEFGCRSQIETSRQKSEQEGLTAAGNPQHGQTVTVPVDICHHNSP